MPRIPTKSYPNFNVVDAWPYDESARKRTSVRFLASQNAVRGSFPKNATAAEDLYAPTPQTRQMKNALGAYRKLQGRVLRQEKGRLLLLSLNGSDGDDADDIVGGTSARQIVHRCAEPLQDGAVRFCPGKTLDQLVSDIRRVEVGEH